MTLFNWVKGEFGPAVAKTFNLKKVDGTALDLTGKTATIKYKNYAGGSVVSRTNPDLVVVGSASAGQIKWTPLAADAATTGIFHAIIEVTDATNEEAIPKGGFDFGVLPTVE